MRKSKRTIRHAAMWESIRAQLREQRCALGMEQAELAKKIGKSQSYVSKYENGYNKLDVVEFVEIVRALNRDAEKKIWIKDIVDKLLKAEKAGRDLR